MFPNSFILVLLDFCLVLLSSIICNLLVFPYLIFVFYFWGGMFLVDVNRVE